MIHEILYKYFHGKTAIPRDEESFKYLEKLTERIVATSSSPEYSIMQILIELSENGVIGLDKDGYIIFSNYISSKIFGEDVKGKSIFSFLNEKNAQSLKEFINKLTETNSTKVEFIKGETSTIYDIAAYRVKNGKICYILFLVNCLEHMMFKRDNCPLKEKCPFNNKCKHEGKNEINHCK